MESGMDTCLPAHGLQPDRFTEVGASTPLKSHRHLNIVEYHEMIDSGALNEDDRVELLDGRLVNTMPKNPPRRITTRLTQKALEILVPPGWYVDAQEPITLQASEPEPDVIVARGDTLEYLDRHPGPLDLALVVEIVDATSLRDQTLKKSLYAAAGIRAEFSVSFATISFRPRS